MSFGDDIANGVARRAVGRLVLFTLGVLTLAQGLVWLVLHVHVSITWK